jgi:hypothetical protein
LVGSLDYTKTKRHCPDAYRLAYENTVEMTRKRDG